jgi:exopolysaccharide biosynthesis predicted pyruvyltransferase EpsI
VPQGGSVSLEAASLVDQLRARVAAELADLAGQPLALVDFPNHANVGDSAIWLGTTEFLRRQYRAEPRYVATMAAFSPAALRRAHPEGPILIHGGGNFGDLWPGHQLFRERLLETFPDRLVVQLPQSIHYQDAALADRTARAIERHGNVRLLVRDRPSLDFASARFSCPVRLCPDLALCLGVMERPAEAEVDVLCLMRTDRERAFAGRLTGGRLRVRVTDWVGEWRLPIYLSQVSAVAWQLWGGVGRPGLRLARYDAAARIRLARGCRLLSYGRVVITDRLHAHLLSLLLGIPHAVLDNSYGKLSRFLDAWTGGAALAQRVPSAEEAVAWAEESLAASVPTFEAPGNRS